MSAKRNEPRHPEALLSQFVCGNHHVSWRRAEHFLRMGRLLQPQEQGACARLLRDERHRGVDESILRCVLICGILEIGGRYDVGSTSEVVYPVRGGMEEWGYAASWFNRYNKVKTVPKVCENNIPVVITEGSNRCLVFLVETENKKKPPKSSLGDNRDVFLISENTRDFWIPVLMRQMTVVLDVLRPYSMIVGVSSERGRFIALQPIRIVRFIQT